MPLGRVQVLGSRRRGIGRRQRAQGSSVVDIAGEAADRGRAQSVPELFVVHLCGKAGLSGRHARYGDPGLSSKELGVEADVGKDKARVLGISVGVVKHGGQRLGEPGRDWHKVSGRVLKHGAR